MIKPSPRWVSVGAGSAMMVPDGTEDCGLAGDGSSVLRKGGAATAPPARRAARRAAGRSFILGGGVGFRLGMWVGIGAR